MKKILATITNYNNYSPIGKQILLDKGYALTENPLGRPYSFEELEALVGDIDGVVCGMDSWTDEVMALAPRLKIIARFGAGIDNVDIDAAKKRGIVVTNCYGINSSSVAEHCIMLILGVLRQIATANAVVGAGRWDRFIFRELKGLTVGMWGFGSIPQLLAEKLSGFGVKLQAYDRSFDKQVAEGLGVEPVDLDTLLATSDVLSLHLPYVKETYHIINKDTIGKMKDGAVLINTARGALVDAQAVADALNLGRLSGFGTDVFEQEPILSDNPLIGAPGFLATPHLAAETYEVYRDTGIATAKSIIDVLEGREPENWVNR